MWQLAVLVVVAVVVIAAVATWSLRGAREEGHEPELPKPGRGSVPSSRPLVPSSQPRVPSPRAAPSGQLLRQGDDVAKSRGRISERVGWLRRNDVDEEMWPAEAFGGVSDEQFWDDLSSDKPLATKARTATPQPDSDTRRRLIPVRPPAATPTRPAPHQQAAQSPAAQLSAAQAPAGQAPAAKAPTAKTPVSHVTPAAAQSGAVSQASTAAFPAVSQASTASFPAIPARPAAPQRAGTYPQPAQPQPAQPQPYSSQQAPSQPAPAQPALPRPTSPSGPMQVTGTGAYPVQPAATPPPTARGRHGSGDDPLTSDAYSLRATGDGRSYRSSRSGAYPATGDFPAATTADFPAVGGYPASAGGGRYEDSRGRSTGGYSTIGYDSGAYPTAPAGGRHSSGGYRRDSYQNADTYPAGDSYRGHRGESGGGTNPYGPSATSGVPTPPYGERYAQPARDNGARDYGARDGAAEYGGPDYGAPEYGRRGGHQAAADYGRDQAARDTRARYQRPATPRGGEPRGGVRY